MRESKADRRVSKSAINYVHLKKHILFFLMLNNSAYLFYAAYD
jgi:hypothetical protein